jgi:hypothetical protein
MPLDICVALLGAEETAETYSRVQAGGMVINNWSEHGDKVFNEIIVAHYQLIMW